MAMKHRERVKRQRKKQKARENRKLQVAELIAQLEVKIRPLEEALNRVQSKAHADLVSGFTSQM
jgi:DNA transposition AAA+ family ATPase